MSNYLRVRYRERMDMAIEHLGGHCVKCGSIENLHIDHIVRKGKWLSLADATRHSLARFMEELTKCQLLCIHCHGIKTNDIDMQRTVQHGQGKTGKRNCYCELCKPLKKAYGKARRARGLR